MGLFSTRNLLRRVCSTRLQSERPECFQLFVTDLPGVLIHGLVSLDMYCKGARVLAWVAILGHFAMLSTLAIQRLNPNYKIQKKYPRTQPYG